MKLMFSFFLGLLIVASLATYWSLPEARSDVPVLYWVTDANPARQEQLDTFHRWLVKNDWPSFNLRVDSANVDLPKRIIQGVSGIGGDLIDIYGGGQLRYLHDIGLVADITEEAERLGFGVSQTYLAARDDIAVGGRQFMFPANVTANMYWVNKATFAKHGLPIPPASWDCETFERVGKQFVEKANPSGQHRTVFFANQGPTAILRRSAGLDTFNETLTRCTLDDARYVSVLRMLHKWTYEDHILPTASETASFATAAGFGGATLQLFNRGNYGMFWMGRYALIQLRQFGTLELAVSEPPHVEFPNTELFTRGVALYTGSRHKSLAPYFLAYLASEDYNQQIVRDADALPPNPAYVRTDAYLRPDTHPNEWGSHEEFARAGEALAVAVSYSPFVLPSVVDRIDREAYEGFMANIFSAEQASKTTADRINAEMQRTLEANPKLRPRYEELRKRQTEIDRLREEGRAVPIEWIENPFHRRYYVFKGWAKEK